MINFFNTVYINCQYLQHIKQPACIHNIIDAASYDIQLSWGELNKGYASTTLCPHDGT